jgi:hypothetical protein
MVTATVTEAPLAHEPVTRDPFIDDLAHQPLMPNKTDTAAQPKPQPRAAARR